MPRAYAQRAGLRVQVRSQDHAAGSIVLRGYRLDGGGGARAVRMSKTDLLTKVPGFELSAKPEDGAAKFDCGLLDVGGYCLFAFADRNANRAWDPGIPEACGWYAARPAGRLDTFRLSNTKEPAQLSIVLRAPTPFPSQARSTEHGDLRQIRGYPVLQLRGDARQRGLAHGRLVARQILDFFEFYVLEDKFRNASTYQGQFAPFLESHFSYPKDFLAEADGVIEGMKKSGVSLRIPVLGRDFTRTDLFAINAYIETRAMRSSCTQFAAWGPQTEGTDVDGEMITGRNMDGEIDIRRTTVHGFLLFAVTPTEPGHKRYVSMMWPGFIGTISGINEDGFYSMENAGPTGPGPVVDGIVPVSWVQRMALATLGADATSVDVQKLLDRYASKGGGACGPGSVILWAVPYTGQEDPAFIYEGDRFGGKIRLPGLVRPRAKTGIMGSNHYHLYGCDPAKPGMNFGQQPRFSSRWRYEAGMHKMESFVRLGRKIGTAQMRELLQCVCHGTTEYAIITQPNQGIIDVATASLRAEAWDAPYRKWTRYRFEDLFVR